ncbi:MAG: type II secretion system secretin GspD [Deltaproteobacteria bacterium]|nr:type II secretion system secretin GspD [Deltaproteobacteria bacterium]MCB9490215.1 type II secretion system secretin GspD [Deltaproteobacteria bacterium]
MTNKQFWMRVALLALVAVLVPSVLPAGPSIASAQETDDDDGDDDGGDQMATTAPTARDYPRLTDSDDLVSIDFTDTDIKQVVKLMSDMTGENFMIDKGVAGTVTIISPTKVTPREAYDIFMSVLAVNGFTTVKVGKLTKIVPVKDASKAAIRTNTSGYPRDNEQFITQLVPLQYINANDVVTAFEGMVSDDGTMFAYGPSNMVIVMDNASNINRLMRIMRRLDVAGGEQEVVVIPLEYAAASVLADVILELFSEEDSGASAAQARANSIRQRIQARRRARNNASAATSSSVPNKENTKILADERTNSLIVKASRIGIRQVRELVRKLDQPLPGGEGKIHVVYLENANADELAQTLAALAGSGTGAGAGASNLAGQRQSRLASQNRNRSSLSNQARSLASGLSGGASSFDTGQQSGIASTTGRFLADFDGAVRITSEPATNSLVIISSNRDFRILKDVIDKLDIPRRQVFVEALILEITMDRGLDLGFEFRSTNDATEDEGVQVIGGTNYGGIQQAAANPLGVTGFAIGAADGTISFGGETFPNIGALFRALATDQDVNVLSTPHVLTLDNEEAEVVVADNVPFVTGQIFSANNTNPTTTIERQDVGITLRLTPQINESDYVKLLIYQEVSQVTDSPEGLSAADVGVTTAKRTADTVVTVKDHQTVIIGGLMQDSVTVVDSKIPVLGDIPILGYLFKSSRKKVSKTNLLIFLTPYVIKDAADLEEVTRMSNKRMEMFREKNFIPERTNDLGLLDPQKMTPSETIFITPMDDTIETDPRVRRMMEERDRSQQTQDGIYDPTEYEDDDAFEDYDNEPGSNSDEFAPTGP